MSIFSSVSVSARGVKRLTATCQTLFNFFPGRVEKYPEDTATLADPAESAELSVPPVDFTDHASFTTASEDSSHEVLSQSP